MIWTLATEDELSETVGIRLLQENGITPFQCLRRGGYGYLRAGMDKWKALAKRQAVVVLTDLDRLACPVALRTDWFQNEVLPAQLCFRIAVREVEAWFLADHDAMDSLYGKKFKLPALPESLPDPKLKLLQLAVRASRDIKHDLVRIEGEKLLQGLGYNTRLCQLAKTIWDPDRAATRSPSLLQARRRISELVARVRG